MKKLVITFITLIMLLLTSCKQEQSQNQEQSLNDSKLDSAIFNSKLEKGMSIAEAKKHQVGEVVTVSGKILGAYTVFVDGRASFVMGDPSILVSCDLKENDNCKTPWDVCCEKKEIIAANTLSIQVVDEAGKVLKTGLKGKNGLKELSLVTIKGKIAPQSNDAVTIINAQAIQIN